MPAQAIPVVATVIALFALFIGFVGGAALWTALPRRAPPRER
ncbi:hypothetical protein [Brevundimonas subvibrioides]|jgi:hypothetical protein|nr:hypothetical protein [Brevundimonas subvibrioides]